MNKKGFTLVELLAVILLMALVAVIAFNGVGAISNTIKKGIWENKIELIENGAVRYGEDNIYEMTHFGQNCGAHENCLTVEVGFLLQRNYIATNDRDEEGNKILINDVTEESVNDTTVNIWLENNVVYAKYND